MYCEFCRVAYPDSYNYCPDHGSRLVSGEHDTGHPCVLCANLNSQGEEFCGKCGADLRKQVSPEVPKNGTAGVKEADGGIASSAANKETAPPRERNAGSNFKKKINDDLAEAFSSSEPHETPWFGTGFGADLLAVAPHGVTVAAIIDPGGIEKATIQRSLFPEGPWLLTTADGTDLPLDNPVTKAKKAMQTVEDRLSTFLSNQRKTLQIKVNGLVVFPDGYNLSRARQSYTLAEGDAQVINASELPKELLKPVHDKRLSADLYRKWLYENVLHNPDDDSIALTWLDPNGETISKRVRSLGAQKEPKDPWSLPPPTSEVFSDANRWRSTPKKRGGMARMAGLSLVTALGLFVLWEIYPSSKPISQLFSDRLVREKTAPRAELPRREDPLPGQKPERKEAPGHRDSSTSNNFPSLTNRNDLTDGKKPEGPNAVPPMEKSFEQRDPAEPTAAWQKTIEYQIDRAIHQRAVEGVVVGFVDDTAYLSGAVLSEKQKAAAEEAARNVPGVKRVRSWISVKWESS